MNIGELFISLGIKGADQTQKALGGIKAGLGETKSMSLEAKAGILAVVYGLEQLMAGSNAAGASLMSYAGATGLSAETLQKWQYAARQADVSAEEMEGSITSLQGAMVKMATGQGVPGGFGVIKNAVGIDPARIRDTMYMMEKLAEYAKTETNVDFANEQLKSFGLSLQMISAMRRNAFSPENFNKAPLYSNAEAATLQKNNVAWRNLQQQFEMGIGHLNAKHGLSIVNDLSKLSSQLIKLIGLFATLAEKVQAFAILGKVFEGWGEIFGLVSEGVDKLTGLVGGDQKDNVVTGASKKIGGLIDSFFDYKDHEAGATDYKVNIGKGISPKVSAGSYHIVNNTDVTANIHGVQNPDEIAKHIDKHISRHVDRTGRQMPAQKRAN